ncbi:MAG TPA: prephenate dehydrogenase [Actinomycetales bacterium]|nr:prephenate dehydrogenase [Actinomycetales bacterium]
MTGPTTTGRVRTTGTVRVVGVGLLGASAGLGLRALGVDVALADPSPSALALAVDLGAGRRAADGDRPALVVVATPPDVTADVVAAELTAHPDAAVTDVASVKHGVRDALVASGVSLARYVGGHPMAGRERSGAVAARGDLFVGRPWVVAPDGAEESAVGAVADLVLDLGALPVVMGGRAHDDAVALVSHLPQLAATLVAARLRDAPASAVDLAGPGLRDVTRIAASDPALWVQILAANAGPVAALLRAVRDDLDGLLGALEALDGDPVAPGARAALARAVAAGNDGVARVPGKHGAPPTTYALVTVVVPDRPGELGRLLAEMGEIGVNLEDLHLEHSPGQPVGLAELSVLPSAREHLATSLEARGWAVH